MRLFNKRLIKDGVRRFESSDMPDIMDRIISDRISYHEFSQSMNFHTNMIALDSLGLDKDLRRACQNILARNLRLIDLERRFETGELDQPMIDAYNRDFEVTRKEVQVGLTQYPANNPRRKNRRKQIGDLLDKAAQVDVKEPQDMNDRTISLAMELTSADMMLLIGERKFKTLLESIEYAQKRMEKIAKRRSRKKDI